MPGLFSGALCALAFTATYPGVTADLSSETAILGDFATWQSPLIVPLRNDSELEVSVSPDFASWGIGRSFPVDAGKRYLISADILVEPGANAYLLAHGDGLDWSALSNTPPDSGAWSTVAIVFDNARAITTTSVDVQLYAVHGLARDASVRLRNVVVSELRPDYGLYVRFTATASSPPTAVGAPYIISRGGAAFYTSIAPAPLTAGEPTAWQNLSELLDADGTTIGFFFTDDSGERVSALDVTIEAAYAPEDAAIFFTRTTHEDVGAVGVVTEGRVPSPIALQDSIMLTKELIARDPAFFRARPGYAPARQPARFDTTTMIGWWDGWGDRAAFAPLYEFMRELGINGLGDAHPDGAEAQLMQHSGLSRRYYHFPVPARWQIDDGSLVDAEIDAAVTDRYDSDPVLQRLLSELPNGGRAAVIDMGDESNGLRFSGASYRDAFRAYLAQQGVTLADVGAASWDDVLPFENMDAGQVDPLRPAPGDAAAGRLFYWRMRFWDEATGYVFGRVADFVRAHSPAGAPLIAPQMGTPFGGYLSARVGLTLPTMARHGAANGFLGEAFLGWNDWCAGQQLAAVADWVDGYATPLGFNRRAGYVHVNRGRGAKKAITLAARGFTHLDYYTYGPYQLTTGDGVAGFGALSEWSLANIHDANDALARVEDAIYGAQRLRGGVAMLATHSDPLWWSAATDTIAYTAALSSDEAGLHVALTHGHHAITFLPEELLPKLLDNETRVLFVQRQHVSDAAFATIRQWVEAGGTLVTVGAAPTHDEFGQASATRAAWLGAIFGPIDLAPSESYGVAWDGVGTISSARPRRQIVPAEDATAFAHYDDGAVAAYDVKRGAGRVRVVAFALGLAYQDLDPVCSDYGLPGRLGGYPLGYVPEVRAAILDSAKVAAPLRPAFADHPLVEVVRLKTASGGAVALVNYTNTPREVTVTVPGFAGDAHTVLGGATVSSNDGTLRVPVDAYEVITWNGALAPEEEAPVDSTPNVDAPNETPGGVASEDDGNAPPATRRGCNAIEANVWMAWVVVLSLATRRRSSRA